MNEKNRLSLGELDMIIFNIGVIASNCTDSSKVNDYFVRDELDKNNNRVLEYQEYLLDTYDDEDLYTIIEELKDFYYDDMVSLPVNRIISDLSKKLYDRLPVEKEEHLSEMVASFSSHFYDVVDEYHKKESLDNMNNIFTYLDTVNSVCSVEEERALVMTLDTRDDKVLDFIVKNINMNIYSKTFKDYFLNKGISGKIKK